MMRTYSELITLPTFEERYEYLKLDGRIGDETFGFDRYFNQAFYSSQEWKTVRREVIVRDEGCDLAIPDREIHGMIFVHHMNPLTLEDLENHSSKLLDPENLITVSKLTHDAITYGDDSIIFGTILTERKPNDTCPWR